MKNKVDTPIKDQFKTHIIRQTTNNIPLVVGIGLLIIITFMFSDLYIRNVINAFYARLLPFLIGLIVLSFYFATKKHDVPLYRLVNLFYTSGPIMLYAMLFVYKGTSTFEETITSTILLIFIMSLLVQTDILNTILIFFLPFIIFFILFNLLTNVSKQEMLEIINIIPMLVMGFIANRVHYKLKYNSFKANYLLEQEKEQTAELYKKELSYNTLLEQKNKEILTQNKMLIEKKQELKLNEAKLKEYNKTKDKFFSIIAHDLRSPFNSMLGSSEILNAQFDEIDSNEKKDYISIIHKGLQDTFKLLENLLYWSRSQSGKIDFNVETIDLHLLYKDINNLLSQPAKNKSITLISQIPNNIHIKADKEMLLTVIRNLISNAIKFTKNNGRIVVIANVIEDDSNNKFTKIIVKDNGIGISKEIQSKLFDVGENISTQGTENERGTGLGLVLCKEFVERHGGKIWVESKIDKGSSFCFTIPYNLGVFDKKVMQNIK